MQTPTKIEPSKNKTEDLLEELQKVLNQYFFDNPKVSLNALSKQCTVSEPTLRRILKGQIKTLPTSTTILDILTTLSGESNTLKISNLYPGPIANYLKWALPQIQDCATEYNAELNAELEDPTKYLIFKLSANSSGLPKKRLQELFGVLGQLSADHLVKKEYLSFDGITYRTTIKHFTASKRSFVKNFKLIADFIKTESFDLKPKNHSLHANYSESLSENAYKDIIRIQEKSLKKIRHIMADDKSKGSIPVFLINAIDTFEA